MSNEVVTALAEGIHRLAAAEDVAERVAEELAVAARSVESNDELRDRLSQARLPLEQRFGLVEDLLGARAHTQTVAALQWLLASGHVRRLPRVAEEVARVGAVARSARLAEVRSAVELNDDQRARLADALSQVVGERVELQVSVDPDLVGGLSVRLGDTVVDGTVERRLADLRAALTGA